MKNNWIKTSEKLPEPEKEILVWAEVGRVYSYRIAVLIDMNIPDGYMILTSSNGSAIKVPNKKHPHNLEWNINGHCYEFDKVSHWMNLEEPNL